MAKKALFRVLFVALVCIAHNRLLLSETALNQADPYPHFSADYAREYLQRASVQKMKGGNLERKDRLNFGTSVFYQNASSSYNDAGDTTESMWNMRGGWNMIGLLYGNPPTGKSLGDKLTAASTQTFNALGSGAAEFNEDEYNDATQKFGFFSVSGKYRKIGIRFDIEGRITDHFGVSVKTGVSDIMCSNVEFSNLSTKGTLYADDDVANANTLLMNQYKDIAAEIGLDIEEYNVNGLEDIRLEVFWKKPFERNKGSKVWPHLIFLPFASIQGSLGTASNHEYTKAFSISTGNRGHASIGTTCGVIIDFAETVEIGAAIGGAHFFKKDITKMFIPTNRYQSSIFPFSTSARIAPGKNLFFEAHLGAFHFLDKLSINAQYVFQHHTKDNITLLTEDSAFIPEKLEDESTWTSQSITANLAYDLSPSLNVGFLWQTPVRGKKTFKSSTLMLSIKGIF
ncbi:hypothetical protein HN446_04580 [bacterium]|jgi:hypothetical protein|nr:hypothetical protein [bacterium]